MNQVEAAAFLGVTEKTLYRYRKQGKLAYRELKGKGRPTIDYDQESLDKLRALLQERQEMMVRDEPSEPDRVTQRVTFGLLPTEFAELEAEALKYDMKVGEYARRLVREGLESRFQEEATALREDTKKIREEVRRVRRDVSNGMEAILEFMGVTPSDAKAWVMKNLR